VQHEFRTAAGTTFFSQQRADPPWKPGLTNVHARQPRVVRQSSPQAPELPLRATLRKSLPGRSVFSRGPSCAEAVPAIPEKATTNADAIIRLRRHMATSCGKLLGSLFRRFRIATGYELAHMHAAIDEAATEAGNAIGPFTSVSRSRNGSSIGFNCQTTRGHAPAFSRLRCARALRNFRPHQKQRAQGKPGARCTRGLVCNLRIRTRTRAYRAAEAFRLSLRDGLRLTSSSPR
jgi:hypothetical protein